MLNIIPYFFCFIISLSFQSQAIAHLFLYQLEDGNKSATPPVYLFGTCHNLPHSYVKEGVKELIGTLNILVKEQHHSKCEKFPELFDFADVSLVTLQEKRYFDTLPPNWPTDYLSQEYCDLLNEKFSQDFRKAWGLEVKGVPPSIVNYCIKSQLEIREKELIQKFPLPEVSSTPEDKNEGGEESTLQTFDSYVNRLRFQKTYGLEDRGTILEVSGELDRLAKEKVEVSIKELKYNLQELINLYALPAEEVIKKLHQKYRKREKLETQLLGETLVEAYLNGDEEQLINLSLESTVKRNKLWLTKLKDIIKNNSGSSIFIIVGCAHLLGEDGLLNLLKEEGLNFMKVSE